MRSIKFKGNVCVFIEILLAKHSLLAPLEKLKFNLKLNIFSNNIHILPKLSLQTFFSTLILSEVEVIQNLEKKSLEEVVGIDQNNRNQNSVSLHQ